MSVLKTRLQRGEKQSGKSVASSRGWLGPCRETSGWVHPGQAGREHRARSCPARLPGHGRWQGGPPSPRSDKLTMLTSCQPQARRPHPSYEIWKPLCVVEAAQILQPDTSYLTETQFPHPQDRNKIYMARLLDQNLVCCIPGLCPDGRRGLPFSPTTPTTLGSTATEKYHATQVLPTPCPPETGMGSRSGLEWG